MGDNVERALRESKVVKAFQWWFSRFGHVGNIPHPLPELMILFDKFPCCELDNHQVLGMHPHGLGVLTLTKCTIYLWAGDPEIVKVLFHELIHYDRWRWFPASQMKDPNSPEYDREEIEIENGAKALLKEFEGL